jgi:hypothetical protein
VPSSFASAEEGACDRVLAHFHRRDLHRSGRARDSGARRLRRNGLGLRAKSDAAFLIFLVAAAIAAGVGALVLRTMGETTTGKVIATVVPILIMAVAGFMILDQLQIAETIVTIRYASLLGAEALGMALAFGPGGREVAARMLEGAYQAGQQNREQVKQDLQQGRDAARDEAERMNRTCRKRTRSRATPSLRPAQKSRSHSSRIPRSRRKSALRPAARGRRNKRRQAGGLSVPPLGSPVNLGRDGRVRRPTRAGSPAR